MSTQILAAALADRYRIERELGQGGMATVFLAEDVRHHRKVALKVLHPELSAVLGPERFLKEIELTASLQHPHILPLFDSGEADGQLFYVMPFVEGETLRARLEREKQLPIEDALRIAREVADALQYAHDRAVVHRDIKPENILLQGGHALVADFGIALAVQQAGGTRMTQTGLSLGTPHYMAPEQAMGEKHIDARADVYALGAVTYEMLVGEPPFTGATIQQIVAKLLTEPVRSVTAMRPAVPAHVEAAVRVALEKLPADRFATVGAFSVAISGATVAHTMSRGGGAHWATPPRWRALIAGGVGIAALAGTVGWFAARAIGRTADSMPPIAVTIATPLVTSGAVLLSALAVSPDGSLLAVPGTDSMNVTRLIVRNLATGGSHAVAAPIATTPAFSPDGRSIAWFDPGVGAMQVSDLQGGPIRTLARFRGTGGLAWSTDSTIVYSAGSGSLYRRSLSGVVDTLLHGDSAGRYFSPSSITRDLLLVGVGPSRFETELATYRISSRRLTRLGVRGTGPQWIDAGIITFLRDGSVWGINADRSSGAVTGAPRVIADGAGSGRMVTTYDVARNGVLVVRRGSTGTQRELVVVERSGAVRTVLAEPRPYRSPRFSPDGDRIAYTLAQTATLGGDVWVVNLEDGRRVRVTTDSANLAPEWSRDGRAIFFGRLLRFAGSARIDRISSQGGGPAAPLLQRPNQIYEFQVTPDGRRVIWREDAAATSRDIYTASLDSPTVIRPLHATQFDERGVALSPDGQWYLYSSTESGESQVYVARLDGDGARWPVSREGGAEARWAANGEVFFRRADSVYATRLALGDVPRVEAPRAVFGGNYMATGFEPMWDVSPDGRRFAMVRVRASEEDDLGLMLNWVAHWRAGAR